MPSLSRKAEDLILPLYHVTVTISRFAKLDSLFNGNLSSFSMGTRHEVNATDYANDSAADFVGCIPPGPETVKRICNIILVPTFFVLGFLGNTIVLIIYGRKSTLPSSHKSPIRILISGLAICDLAVLVTAVTLFTAPYISDQFALASPVVFGLAHSARTATVWTQVAIAIDRWFAVCKPLHHEVTSSLTVAKVALVGIFGFSIVYNVPRFLTVTIVRKLMCATGKETYLPWATWLHDEPWYQHIYVMTGNLVVMYFVPFAIIIILNMKIYCALRHAFQERDGLMQKCKFKQERSTTVMLCAEALVFLLANTLPMVMNCIETLSSNWYWDNYNVARSMQHINNALVAFNSATNIIIFYAFGSEFRRGVHHTMCRGSALLRGRLSDHTSFVMRFQDALHIAGTPWMPKETRKMITYWSVEKGVPV